MSSDASNGHRLVLFDIDGTLLSAGRVARDSILPALETAFGWKATRRSTRTAASRLFRQDRSPDRPGARRRGRRTRALRARTSPARCELYLEELERGLTPGTVVPKPGISPLLARLAADPSVTLGLLTGNLEPGARLKLAPPDYNRYFPFGAFGSDSADRYAASAGRGGPRARAHRPRASRASRS